MDESWSALPEIPVPPLSPPAALDPDRLQVLRRAAAEQHQALEALRRGGLNVVGEVLKGQGTFYEMNHYPEGDVFDDLSHAQYYYHAHRDGEHGHFHTFVRRAAMPADLKPAAGFRRSEPGPQGEEALAHLIGISMDSWGYPLGLFAANRWVTGESWYSAEDCIALLDRFHIDHARPNLAVNLWLTAFMRLFRPQIALLLRHRDRVIEAWQAAHPERDVLEDRSLEITGYLPIDVRHWVAALDQSAV